MCIRDRVTLNVLCPDDNKTRVDVDVNLEDTYCLPVNLTIPRNGVELIFYISIVAVDVVVHAHRSEKLMMWIMIYVCRKV